MRWKLMGVARCGLRARWLTRSISSPCVVCWHGDVIPNSRSSTVPLVEFGLRECDPEVPLQDLVSTGNVKLRADQATFLGQYRVGTVLFPDGSRQDPLAECLPHSTFDVDFGESGWEWQSAGDLQSRYGNQLPWLGGAPSNLQMIAFELEGRGSLIVSCIEFFWRCYGRAKELQRILLTYPWREAERRLLVSGIPQTGVASTLRLGQE